MCIMNNVLLSCLCIMFIVSVSCLLQQQNLLSGPRIKHVCRAAAVALGQPRAMVPDDIPRLSALPMHEREGIAPSPTAEGMCRLCIYIEGIYRLFVYNLFPIKNALFIICVIRYKAKGC